MKVLFSSTPGLGHVQPMLALADALAARGHDVRWATAPAAAALLRTHGFETFECGLDLAEQMAEYQQRWPGAKAFAGPDLADHMFPHMFGEVAAAHKIGPLNTAVEQWQPDTIVHETADLAAPLAARMRGICQVTHSFGLAVPPHRLALAARQVEWLWDAAGVAMPPMAGAFNNLYIDIFPPSLQAADDLAHVGRIQRQRPSSTVPSSSVPLPDEVAAALHAGEPVIYLTFGTVFNSNATFGNAVQALSMLDATVIVTVGPNGNRAAFGPQPANVHIFDFIPQAAVLARCELVVSHAGSGTLLGALAAGLPQLCLPQAADQFANANACEAANAGLALWGDDATTDSIGLCANQLLADARFRRAAEGVSAEIASMPTPDDVASVIEAL